MSTQHTSGEGDSLNPISLNETVDTTLLPHAIVGQPPSYVRNCVTMGRGDGRLFLYHVDGTLLPTLDGYAIIPVGLYYDLIREPLPEKLRQFAGDAQEFRDHRIGMIW